LTKTAHFIAVHTTYSIQDYAELYINQIVRLHGIPKTIVSDRGTQFVACFWEQLHESLGTKLIEPRSNLGQPGTSPRESRHWTLLNPLTKPTHTRGQPVVKGMVKPRLTIDVGECRPELLPRSPNFT
jgi:hypothetical protein